MPKPGDSITTEFVTSAATGAAANADSLPIAALARNGTDDGAVTVTITNVDGGRYKAAFTIPTTYVSADQLCLMVSATISGIAAKGKVWEAQIDQQDTMLQMRHGVKGKVWIVDPVNGNDSNAGTWASPFATPLPTASGGTHPASAGDLVLICGGTCSLGSSRYIMVAGVTLAGMGKEATTITSSILNAEIIKVASNCTVRDLTVKSTLAAGANNFNYPIGANLTTVNNVLIQRVAGYADTDIFYFTGAGSTVTIEDCTPHSNWDCAFASGAGTYVQILRTPIFTTASNSASPNSNSSVQATDGAFVRLVDCPIVNFNTNTNASRITHVVHTGNSGTAGARIELIRSPILMSVDGSTQQTILADTGTTVVLENSPYDFTKTSGAGTITEQTNKSGVDFNNLAQATGATTLNNITVPTVTNLTNLPAIPTNWLTAAGINAGALNGKGDWLLASSYVVPPTAVSIATAVWQDLTAGSDFTTNGSVGKLIVTDLDTNIGSRLATSGYTVPPTAAAIAAAILTDTTDLSTAGSLGHVVTQWGTMVNGSNQFTVNALANAPSGGAGGTQRQISIVQRNISVD